jgi:CDGSH iron-sulfur domain-containing protein 3
MEPKIAQKGPYIKDMNPGTYYWCRCDQSAAQPFCDGSHKRLDTGMTPMEVEITESKKVAWCGCKRTENQPFCDGTHKTL